MKKSEKRILWICYLLISTYILTLITCALFPIYPDEVATRQLFSRLAFDFPLRSGVFPTCTESFAQIYPFVWIIPAALEWLIHGFYGNFFVLRGVGLLISICFTILLVVALKKINFYGNQTITRHKTIFLYAVVIIFISIGVYPFCYILNRNEQLILTSVLLGLFVSYSLFERGRTASNKGLIFSFIAFVLLAMMVFYSHPKSFYLLPFFAIVFLKFALTFKRLSARLILLLIILPILITSFKAWSSFFQCPEVPYLATFIQSQNINPSLIFNSFIKFLLLLNKSLSDFYIYFNSFTFQKDFEVNYLPGFHHAYGLHAINFLIKLTFILVILFPLSLIFILKIEWKNKHYLTFNLALFFLYVSGIISSILRIEKHWYDSGYLYSISLLVMVWMVAVNEKFFIRIPNKKFIFYLFALISLISQLIFNAHFLPKFIKGFTGPGVSLIYLAKNKISDDSERLLKKCKIDINRSSNLIVDDLTYQFAYRSKNPISITYIWISGDSHHSENFVANIKSSGMILSCSSMSYFAPELYRTKALRSGDLCCVPAQDLKFICKNHLCN